MTTKSNRRLKLAVVGGGMSGIASAIRLARSGRFDITLIEKDEQVGGLCSSFSWKDITWDRFYHVILSGDSYTIGLLKELGIDSTLEYRKTSSGFSSKGRLAPMGSAIDFLRFPFLNLWQKFRLGAGILYAAGIKDSRSLSGVSAEDWLKTVFGGSVYSKIWTPLLRSKLGGEASSIQASFILKTIQRLYGARDAGGGAERMGQVSGGYRAVIDASLRRMRELGIKVMTSTEAVKLEKQRSQQVYILHTKKGRKLSFDTVLLALPSPAAARITRGVVKPAIFTSLRETQYLGVTCAVLISSQSLSPYYVINLLDEGLPFTGIIEGNNASPEGAFGGRYIIYLPRYRSSGEKKPSPRQYTDQCLIALEKMFPHFDRKSILHSAVFNAEHVQPIQRETSPMPSGYYIHPADGLYISNSSMVPDVVTNVNVAVMTAESVSRAIESAYSD